MSTTTLEAPTSWDYTTTAPLRMAPVASIDPQAALMELRGIIEHAILNQPRSLQRTIGPSEIGTECDHCLAAKLAGWEQTEKSVPWLPFVGTAVHAALEEMVIRHEAQRNAVNTTGIRYLCEQRTMVGTIDGNEIWGSTDLVDLAAAMTVDYKVVGVSTLRKAKTGPSRVYRVQQQLYAKGWNDAGHRIDHVSIYYLPRNATSLAQGIQWHEPYDPAFAQAALDRANQYAMDLRAMATISLEARDAWISSLPRSSDCWDCSRFADAPQTSLPTGSGDPSADFLGIS